MYVPMFSPYLSILGREIGRKHRNVHVSQMSKAAKRQKDASKRKLEEDIKRRVHALREEFEQRDERRRIAADEQSVGISNSKV